MAASSLKEEIVHQIDKLTPEQQRELLDYARRLQALPAGTPGEVLLAHMGNFDFELGEVDNMMRAIEAACEGIDLNEWK